MDIPAIASPAGSTSAFSSLTKNIDTFLTLLATQLRNQDPLEPLDTEKFTSQLVQFASVEQSIRANSHLEALIALQGAEDRQSALTLVGREVAVASDKAALGPAGASWRYALPKDAAVVALTILDSSGATVARGLGEAGAGAHDFSWNGLMADGRRAANGVYTLSIDAAAAGGGAVAAEIESTIRVTAAEFRNGTTSLESAIGAVPVENVRRVAAEPNF